MGKKLNCVTVFFDENDFESLALEAHSDDRTPAEFLRRLFRLHIRQKIAEHAQACADKQRELDASGSDRAPPSSATNVADFLRQPAPVKFTRGFQDTENAEGE
jgi:hypothetical protein